MIVKEVLKTTFETGFYNNDDSSKKLTASVGTHNLTELRQKLEQRMLLTTHNKYRTITADSKQEWPSFHSTPYEDESQENRHSNGSSPLLDLPSEASLKKDYEEEDDVPIKPFGKKGTVQSDVIKDFTRSASLH